MIPLFKAVGTTLLASKQELRVRGFSSVRTLNSVLRNIAALVPLEAQMDKAGQRIMQVFPPYDLSFEGSLPALLADVANRVKIDPDRSWLDPFHEFSEASEQIVQHYREISGNTAFECALLEKWIVESIIRAACVHLHLLPTHPPALSSSLISSTTACDRSSTSRTKCETNSSFFWPAVLFNALYNRVFWKLIISIER